MIQKTIFVNGVERNVVAESSAPLSTVIRETLGLTGTKVGCGEGQCGACSIIMDGKIVRSCITKFGKVADHAQITTIEGIGQPGNLHVVQKAWIKYGAAQCGFCSPGFIVSATRLLEENTKPTRDEVREWFQKHRNVCRCTGYIPLVDAVMAAAEVVRGEKPASSLEVDDVAGTIWGSKHPRPTAERKVTGMLDYGADLGQKLPANTLHIALVQAKVSHANIKGIDTSEAEKMPGVVKVVTHKDIQGKNRITGLITFPTNLGDGWDRPILCDEKIFQYGDAVAMVCANTYAEAVAAAEKVVLDLEELPAYMNVFDAKAADAIEIHPGTPNTYFKQGLVKGDETAPYFESGDYVTVEESILTSRQPHLPIEPDVGFAYYSDDGKLHIHSKSIGVHLHLYMIAPGLGIEPEQLVIQSNPMGGTFGYKFSPTMEALVGAATMATGRPCFLKYTYRQQQQYTGKRSPWAITTKLAATKEGKLVALETDYDVDHGPYSEFGDLLTIRGAQFIGGAYSIPNMRGEGRTVATNHAWGSAFRGYGGPQATLTSETLMDKLATELGMDPLELRYINALRPGDTNNSGQAPDSYAIPAMIDDMRPKYQAALANAKANSTDTIKKGVGIAIGSYGAGLDGADSSAAYVEMHADGSITAGSAWQDHGQGADIGAVGTVSEALKDMQIPVSKIHFTWPNTEKCPNSGPSGGSRSQVMIGNALINACEQLLAAAKKADGTYMTYDEMVAAGKETRYDGAFTMSAKDIDVTTGQGAPFGTYMYGVCMAEVTVDTVSGKVTVDAVKMNTDIGKVNNFLTVDGQMMGGIAQAIGYALYEDFEDIQKHATMIGAGIPQIKQIPDNIEVKYFEEPREHGPFGASGVGEVPLVSPHAAVINAIYNATGARITRIPAIPERVLDALKNK